MARQQIFEAIRAARQDKRFDIGEVQYIDECLDAIGVPRDNQRHVSKALIEVLKGLEGVRLKAYPDPATNGDPWTIGVGHTGPEVHNGMTITAERSDELLREDLAKFEVGVEQLCPVTTQGQFDALVSFSFNLGLARLKDSTLRRLHNDRNYDAAAREFQKWDKAGGRIMPGLTKRRAMEAAIYAGGPK